MSWESYVDNMIAHSIQNADKGAIIGLDGGIWTPHSGQQNILELSGEEAQTIARVIQSGDVSAFQANGCKVEGVKYNFLRETVGLYIFKKKEHGGLSMAKTTKAVVIGHYAEGKTHEQVNLGVAKISEYMKSLNF
ncbi:DgyrCDS12107 [Dimorphilus gyrociliatus]|uniref:Profilin n=1 Tax=Dimorphilus gyrociliatus TaxID=2664684 RepID=A0A7I8W5H2_9ANNE|nr:DgyrCDS12107 [Dimorphilus gyrociliatus]